MSLERVAKAWETDALPVSGSAIVCTYRGSPGEPGGAQENAKIPKDSRSEEEEEEKGKRRESEEEAEENVSADRERAAEQPRNVLPFPNARADDHDDGSRRKTSMLSETEKTALTYQVSRILKLPATEALTRLVTDYAPVSSLSLPGEADAAREWIDDPRRNRKRKHMTPAFFRNWLKREVEACAQRQRALEQVLPAQATGTAGEPSMRASAQASSSAPRAPNLMYLADEDGQAARTKGTAR